MQICFIVVRRTPTNIHSPRIISSVPLIPISVAVDIKLYNRLDGFRYHLIDFTGLLDQQYISQHSITATMDFTALSHQIHQNLCLILTRMFEKEKEDPTMELIFNVYKEFEIMVKM